MAAVSALDRSHQPAEWGVRAMSGMKLKLGFVLLFAASTLAIGGVALVPGGPVPAPEAACPAADSAACRWCHTDGPTRRSAASRGSAPPGHCPLRHGNGMHAVGFTPNGRNGRPAKIARFDFWNPDDARKVVA